MSASVLCDMKSETGIEILRNEKDKLFFFLDEDNSYRIFGDLTKVNYLLTYVLQYFCLYFLIVFDCLMNLCNPVKWGADKVYNLLIISWS